MANRNGWRERWRQRQKNRERERIEFVLSTSFQGDTDDDENICVCAQLRRAPGTQVEAGIKTRPTLRRPTNVPRRQGNYKLLCSNSRSSCSSSSSVRVFTFYTLPSTEVLNSFYVCMYVCMYVCVLYVCMYVCVCVCVCVCFVCGCVKIKICEY